MADSRKVARAHVLKVLKENKVPVTQSPDRPDAFIIEDKDGDIDVLIFEDEVHNRMLQRLKRKYGVAIHLFYNQLQVVEGGKKDVKAAK